MDKFQLILNNYSHIFMLIMLKKQPVEVFWKKGALKTSSSESCQVKFSAESSKNTYEEV